MGFFEKLRLDRGLRPEKRSSALISIANSLATIARGVQITVLREYGVDLDAPPPSRSEQTVEVWAPMSADNKAEALREERQRAAMIEADMSARGNFHTDAAVRKLAMTFARGGDSDDELSPEESRFLNELDTDKDER